MQLISLEVLQFRNHEQFSLEFDGSIVGFAGDNGVGKTNILDAIHYLCMAKSHFSGLDREVVMQELPFFRLTGVFQTEKGGKEKVSIIVEPGKRKEIEVNGKKMQSISDFVGRFPVLFQAPDDIYHLIEQGQERRKWIDKSLSQMDRVYLNDLIQYTRTLKQRNAFLKSVANSNAGNYNLLDVYDEKMGGAAARIARRRREYVLELLGVFHEYYNNISGGLEHVHMEYESCYDAGEWIGQWRADRNRDVKGQRTHRGVHKDDLAFLMDGKSLKRFASQGQIKSFMMALVLSQYKVLSVHAGKAPVLLLDDIFARLDLNRVKSLLLFLSDMELGSVFLTDTDPKRLKEVMKVVEKNVTLFEVLSKSVINNYA
jgi:DNA replication and repair protein RecF